MTTSWTTAVSLRYLQIYTILKPDPKTAAGTQSLRYLQIYTILKLSR